MNSEKLRYWASLIYIPDNLQLRDAPGSSIHQEKIKEILALVQEAKENPTVEVYERLRSVRPIACPDNEPGLPNICKYLQYVITQLDGFVQKDEGA